MHLLFVDDDRLNTLLFEETCRLDPTLDLRTAGDGAEALEACGPASGWRPDLLVIDLHLPDTDGCTLLAQLRALPGMAATPAFLCTADEGVEVSAAAAAAGFNGCWSKPMDLQAMLAELGRLSRSQPAPDRGA